MANPYRGEVSFEASGKTYTMVFTTNAICSLEDESGLSFQEVVAKVELMGVRGIRKLALAGLSTKHPDLSAEEVGDIIDAVGVPVISDAIISSFNKSAFSEAAQKQPGPRRPASGRKAG